MSGGGGPGPMWGQGPVQRAFGPVPKGSIADRGGRGEESWPPAL